MSVVAGLGKAAVAGVLGGARPTRGRTFPKTKWKSVVALVLLAVVATLSAVSQAPNAKHSYYSAASSTPDRSAAAAAPVSSEPQAAAPQHMSEREALAAYGKLPLSFVPNEGQTDKAVRYYAQGAGYGFFFTHKGATLSFSEGKGRGGQALALDFLGADPHAKLTAKSDLRARSTTW